MNLFTPPVKPKSEVLGDLARSVLQMGNETYTQSVRRYNRQYDAAWHNANIATIAEAQEMLDAMGPGKSAQTFQASFALGTMLNTIAPGTIPPERMAPPVPYSGEPIEIVPEQTDPDTGETIPAVMGLRIVLDPTADYPGPLTD